MNTIKWIILISIAVLILILSICDNDKKYENELKNIRINNVR